MADMATRKKCLNQQKLMVLFQLPQNLQAIMTSERMSKEPKAGNQREINFAATSYIWARF